MSTLWHTAQAIASRAWGLTGHYWWAGLAVLAVWTLAVGVITRIRNLPERRHGYTAWRPPGGSRAVCVICGHRQRPAWMIGAWHRTVRPALKTPCGGFPAATRPDLPPVPEELS